MEEHKPFGEDTTINQVDDAYQGSQSYSAKVDFNACLRIFCADKLVCIHFAALEHKKRKLNSALEAALFEDKAVNGEMPIAY